VEHDDRVERRRVAGDGSAMMVARGTGNVVGVAGTVADHVHGRRRGEPTAARFDMDGAVGSVDLFDESTVTIWTHWHFLSPCSDKFVAPETPMGRHYALRIDTISRIRCGVYYTKM